MVHKATLPVGIPTADRTANVYFSDVIGNKTDTSAGNSLYAKILGVPTTAYFTVPTADSTANTYERDVIGNKSDTTAGNSIVGLSKAIKAKTDTIPTSPVGNADITIPAQNSTANVIERDVIGNKTDTTSGNSLYSKILIVNAKTTNLPSSPANEDTLTTMSSTLSTMSSTLSTLTTTATFTVPAQNSTANVLERDVIGNKTDSVSGDSLYSKILIVNAKTTNLPSSPANEDTLTTMSSTLSTMSSTLSTLTTTATFTVPTADSTANTYERDVIGNKTDTVAGNSAYAYIKTLIEHTQSASKVYPTLAGSTNFQANASTWTFGNYTAIVPVNTIASPFDIHFVTLSSIGNVAQYEFALYSGADTASTVEVGRIRFTKTSAVEQIQSVPIITPILTANHLVSGRLASSTSTATAGLSLVYHTY